MATSTSSRARKRLRNAAAASRATSPCQTLGAIQFRSGHSTASRSVAVSGADRASAASAGVILAFKDSLDLNPRQSPSVVIVRLRFTLPQPPESQLVEAVSTIVVAEPGPSSRHQLSFALDRLGTAARNDRS